MKNVLITGTSHGIGEELVKQYAQEGCNVIAGVRDEKDAQELSKISHVKCVQMDVCDTQSIQKAAEQLKDQPIDMIINNAAIKPKDEKELGQTENSEEWEDVFATNVMGPLRVVNAFLPNLKKGSEKCIVNMSDDIASLEKTQGGGHAYLYRASKAALNSLTRSLAGDLKNSEVTVVSLHPGWVKTEIGGEKAPMKVQDSAKSVRQVVSKIKKEDTGKFYSFSGEELPW